MLRRESQLWNMSSRFPANVFSNKMADLAGILLARNVSLRVLQFHLARGPERQHQGPSPLEVAAFSIHPLYLGGVDMNGQDF
jgi:hypothetical protein